MDKPVFDGAAFVSIDLRTGQVSTRVRDHLALVTTEILSMIPPSDAVREAAKSWGEKHGKTLQEQVDTDLAGIESLASHLGGTIASFGMGRLRLETRHDALLFRMMGVSSNHFSDGQGVLLSGFLSGYLGAVSSRPFSVLDLGPQGEDRLFWAGNPKAVDEVKQSVARGMQPLDAIETLETGDASC